MERVAKLDTEWALAELNHFLRATDQIPYDNTGSGVFIVGTHMRSSETEASERAHVTEQILDRVLPGWRKDRPEKDSEYTWLRDQAARAKAALRREAELAEKLGDNAPDMDAANLHPWAWENGRSLWNTGHYHQAVMQAAIRINAETQAKLGRMDVSEAGLFTEAFSANDPKPGAPRLRLAEDDGSKTYENLHRGARAFADGLYTAIRNPGMHTPSPSDGGEEQLALEQLAAFSLLARWVDQAKLEEA
ncbi:TIGR02391 family protein [Nocardioides sp. NPDC058538]|uniref:TIGR02391 family protein n=1 Tax=Nocardioides sp. NPDC058538 TaxID=3346542 RepID=UPI003669BD2F